MELTNVSLIVIPASTLREYNGKEYNTNKLYNTLSDGGVFSTPEKINVNRASNGFSVLYTDKDLKELDAATFTSELIVLLMNNIPKGFSITIKYYYQDVQDNYHIGDGVVLPLLDINNIIERLSGELIRNGEKYIVRYIRDESITEIKRSLEDAWQTAEDEQLVDGVLNSVNNDINDLMDVDDDFEVDPSVINTLESIIGNIDAPKGKSKKKKSKGKNVYSVTNKSRIFKEAKNPKRDVKRHGVVITRDKDDIKRDLKTIRAFLKEFIPGNQDWVKRFRDELAVRWINMYTIRLKELKKLEKKEKEKKKDKERAKRNKEILDFTRNLFTVPINSWDDPNK